MILINIILLYFIEITHTDDFPSTGTRLVGITNAVLYKIFSSVNNRQVTFSSSSTGLNYSTNVFTSRP